MLLISAAAPVAGQSFADLDALSDQTAEEARGLALARQKAGRGRLLEALLLARAIS